MSGGMRQRAMIALALASSPKLLLADEPTTALDATVQIQVILLLRQLQRDLRMAVIFVTHDIGVATEISDQVAVMYGGRIVENGKAREVLKSPRHPYTEGLLSSTVHGARKGEKIDAIPGMPPNLANLPRGCAFAPRCRYATDACRGRHPAAGNGVGRAPGRMLSRPRELPDGKATPSGPDQPQCQCRHDPVHGGYRAQCATGGVQGFRTYDGGWAHGCLKRSGAGRGIRTGDRPCADFSSENGVEAILVSGFGDPGVRTLKEELSIPVTGIAEAGIVAAGTTGQKILDNYDNRAS